MTSKPRLATCSLAGCFGCHMSVLDLDLRLLDLAALVEFDRSPVNDLKRFRGRCAIGIVEGACCNEENVHVLEEFRKGCDVLIALGDCAISGGIPAMRNNVPLRECLEQAYLAAPGLWNPAAIIPNDPELPLLLNRTYPCSEVVKVDVSIPGCPPPADAIGQALTAALGGRPIQLEYGVLKYD
jgi:NAD-reducing hydrogenase small subunit